MRVSSDSDEKNCREFDFAPATAKDPNPILKTESTTIVDQKGRDDGDIFRQ